MANTDLRELEAGLDELERPAERTRRRRTLIALFPPLVALGVFLLVWQLAASNNWGGKRDEQLPSPGQTWTAAADQWDQGRIQAAILNSLIRGGQGFLAALIVGTLLGLLMARVKFVRAAIGPFVSGLQSLPSVAWVPAGIIWFGIGESVMYFVILMGAVPSIANGLLAGIDQIPPLYGRVGRVLGARGLTAMRHVTLPAALPGYLAGLKQGWAFSWRSLMAAELIAQSSRIGLGLGQYLDEGRQLSDMGIVVSGIAVILAVGVGIELLVFAPIERRILQRRGLGVRT
ncbi:MAG: ABC transporter permease [Mycobacteriales bacterium]